MAAHIYALIAFCIATETLSVTCFKRGVDNDESNEMDVGFIKMVITRPLFWLGILCWGVELVAWIVVLEEMPLSVAFPMMSLVYCTVPLAGRLLLHEKLPKRQWLAAALITAGVALVGSTGI